MSDFIEDQPDLGFQQVREQFYRGMETSLPMKAPANRKELRDLVEKMFGLNIPERSMCPHHASPMDYLEASFFDQENLIVWANRGGGKTLLAAAATVLEAIFHGPLKSRILGGSYEQSQRMAEYIRLMLIDHPELLEEPMSRRRVSFISGSDIEMLAQSQQAVRGQHVQKIRCDEVELFDPEVWRALQFSVHSKGQTRGTIEVLSTLHRPGGLMRELVDLAEAEQGGFRIIRWCLWDVIERCPASRRCQECLLAEDCGGLARQAEGFYPIDDAISVKARSSQAAWDAEMLCRGTQRDYQVFTEFDRRKHIRPLNWCNDWPTFRAMDFGYRSPMVCLWIQVSPAGTVHVMDEYVQTRLPISQHARNILARHPRPVVMTYVDPAGNHREATSGAACTELLEAGGIPCQWRNSSIADGLELIRAALSPAGQGPELLIDPRCRNLIDAFENYHYAEPGKGDPDQPVKDGPDHLIDSLRYFFVNRMRPQRSFHRRNRY